VTSVAHKLCSWEHGAFRAERVFTLEHYLASKSFVDFRETQY